MTTKCDIHKCRTFSLSGPTINKRNFLYVFLFGVLHNQQPNQILRTFAPSFGQIG